ncbi:DUF1059 domain-containing protein [Halobacterium yunchengense]|uniref:DUF1059 domain-containing protein n=1 Tax=Halobacterium yunchengense TaxID=3108497 RepID=UPI00300A1268
MAHQYECSACGFMVRSEDDDELIDIVREHANDAHGLNITRSEVREGWEPAPVEADD